jgi:carbamoyl-phosphate synthase small subunit|tara:strand:+ start:213 stop:1328 length:1116 start_codon:yes stop_codon:yes gene_type:complete
MIYKVKNKAVLLLEDGTVFHGYSAGKSGYATGELCFNTGMTGYQEVFTDPSYYGQLMITTNAHIGNYGVIESEVESNQINISGLICKNLNTNFSRISGDGNLNDYFTLNNKVIITDVDTRAVVRHIRDKGAMNAIISTSNTDVVELANILNTVPSMQGLELSSKVSTAKPYFFGNEKSKIKIAVLDLGIKTNILRCLSERGCFLKVFPIASSYEELKFWNPDGFFLSNGPGDPSVMKDVIKTAKDITNDGRPVFGICLGHQILALSEGVGTYKMHNGHRGINHPVRNVLTGKSEVTSQNHGFGISMDDVNNNNNIDITHINLNDDTIEGISFNNKNCFSVQYHPESSPGPHDSRYLFDQFIERINQFKNNE